MTTPTIRYLTGDATDPVGSGPRIIAHLCNDAGKWGAGFVLAVSARFPRAEAEYRRWAAGKPGGGMEPPFGLGAVQFVGVGPDLCVANMVGQHGIGHTPAGPPIRYEALAHCLVTLEAKAGLCGASVHMPRIGCGLAGGRWERVEALVMRTLVERGVRVTVYDLAGSEQRKEPTP